MFERIMTQEAILALTLWRPWTAAVLYGGKRVENRPWRPWKSVIDRFIAIHAGLKYDVKGAKAMIRAGLYTPPPDQDCPKAAIVGLARVVGYVHDDDEDNTTWIGMPEGVDPRDDPWYSGPFGWLLDDVIPLKRPVPCRGGRGLWVVEGGALSTLAVELKASLEAA